MEIIKHSNNDFGNLTTIKSPKTGKIMFVGKEIAKSWGHTNLTQAIKAAKLDKEEFKVIHLKQFPDFKKQLGNLGLVTPTTPTFTLISESGLYKLAIASNLEKGKKFRDWITKEVLPSIRENGSYSIQGIKPTDFTKQLIREVQLNNSKSINKKNFENSGVPAIINYNKANCKQVTGLEPSQIKKIAGVKSKSAKEVLRQTNPELAATMSLNDHFVLEKGAELEQLKKLDKAAILLFKEVNRLGFRIID